MEVLPRTDSSSTILIILVSVLGGVGLGAAVATSSCELESWWNPLAAWRAMGSTASNPLLQLLAPDVATAAKWASGTLLTTAAGVVGYRTTKHDSRYGGRDTVTRPRIEDQRRSRVQPDQRAQARVEEVVEDEEEEGDDEDDEAYEPEEGGGVLMTGDPVRLRAGYRAQEVGSRSRRGPSGGTIISSRSDNPLILRSATPGTVRRHGGGRGACVHSIDALSVETGPVGRGDAVIRYLAPTRPLPTSLCRQGHPLSEENSALSFRRWRPSRDGFPSRRRLTF